MVDKRCAVASIVRLLSGVLVAVAAAGVCAETRYRLVFEAELDRSVQSFPAAQIPGNETPRTVSGYIGYIDAPELATAPSLVPGGRGWATAIKSISIREPFNVRFSGGLVTQSDGAVSLVFDPLHNREYELHASLDAAGDSIVVDGVEYQPSALHLFQRGHPDQRTRFLDLMSDIAKLKSARALLTYRATSRGSGESGTYNSDAKRLSFRLAIQAMSIQSTNSELIDTQ